MEIDQAADLPIEILDRVAQSGRDLRAGSDGDRSPWATMWAVADRAADVNWEELADEAATKLAIRLGARTGRGLPAWPGTTHAVTDVLIWS